MKKGFTTPFSSFFPGRFFSFFAFFDSLKRPAPVYKRRGAFSAHRTAGHIPQRRCIPFNKTPEKGTCRMEPQETAKRETEPEEEARRLRFNELWLQVIERSEQRAAQAP